MLTTLKINIIDICSRLGRGSKFENTFIHYNYSFVYGIYNYKIDIII